MSTPEAAEHVGTVTLGAGGAYQAGFALARAGRRVVMVDTKGRDERELLGRGPCALQGCLRDGRASPPAGRRAGGARSDRSAHLPTTPGS